MPEPIPSTRPPWWRTETELPLSCPNVARPLTASTEEVASVVPNDGRAVSADELSELLEVDIATRDDRDDRPFTCAAGQSRRDGERTCSLCDHARFFGNRAHRAPHLLECDHDRSVDDPLH